MESWAVLRKASTMEYGISASEMVGARKIKGEGVGLNIRYTRSAYYTTSGVQRLDVPERGCRPRKPSRYLGTIASASRSIGLVE